MKNLKYIHKRYIKDPLSVRLGGLAANLARIDSFSGNYKNHKAVGSLIEESKFFIEWTALDASEDLREKLVDLQIKLALWQRIWPRKAGVSSIRKDFKRMAHKWAGYILAVSGLNKR